MVTIENEALVNLDAILRVTTKDYESVPAPELDNKFRSDLVFRVITARKLLGLATHKEATVYD